MHVWKFHTKKVKQMCQEKKFIKAGERSAWATWDPWHLLQSLIRVLVPRPTWWKESSEYHKLFSISLTHTHPLFIVNKCMFFKKGFFNKERKINKSVKNHFKKPNWFSNSLMLTKPILAKINKKADFCKSRNRNYSRHYCSEMMSRVGIFLSDLPQE